MKSLAVSLLVLTTLSAGQTTETFTGVIADGICAVEGHASMKMGPTDADCARTCVETHDTQFVLLGATAVYQLSNQQAAAKFAAQRVSVTGTLDAATKTIRVASIAAAP